VPGAGTAADPVVLVVTGLEDASADQVIEVLGERGVPVARVDLADFPCRLAFSARIPTPGGAVPTVSGVLRTATRVVDLAGVRAFYYRRPQPFQFPPMTPEDRTFALLQGRYGFGGVLAALPGCLYVNHPQRVADAEVKPVQWAVAADVGLDVPATLVTNDPGQARAFAAEVGRVVYKPLRSAPLYGPAGEPAAVYVREVDPAGFDDSLRLTAHAFQALVDKAADVRVTVIGSRVFAVRIDSGLLDWREDYGAHSYTVVGTPPALARALHAYLARFGLVFGAFDFALDRNGGWVFLECNPNGQWAWLEGPTGLPMTAALADLLQAGGNRLP
jgi:ATP-grasp ribosomal peptide maturase